MENQQPRFLKSDLRLLAMNAMFGDGYYWKHPECKNWKIVFTSTRKEFLQVKMNLASGMFPSGINVRRKEGAKNCHANAKTLYGITSLVSEQFTEASIFRTKKEDLFRHLTINDFGLWYLDDGGFTVRKDAKKYTPRFFLCIGENGETPEKEKLFKKNLKRLFGKDFGSIFLNNSGSGKSIRNKVWFPTIDVGDEIVKHARTFLADCYKYPDYFEG